MSGPQFMHTETYAMEVSALRKGREAARAANGEVVDRKLTVEEICGEAARLPGFSPHLDETQPPELLFGVRPEAVPGLLKERIKEANKLIREERAELPRGQRRSGLKTIRKDAHVLLTFVASYPVPWVDPHTGRANMEDSNEKDLLDKWKDANLVWFKAMGEVMGFEVASVVLHVDEAYPHLHVLALPLNAKMSARDCHPGYSAREFVTRREGEGDKSFKGRKNKAYKDAMRELQDDYFETVSAKVGLLRTGPKRRRLPNAVYKAEKQEAKAKGLAQIEFDRVTRATENKEKELELNSELVIIARGDRALAAFEESQARKRLDDLSGQESSKQSQVAHLERTVQELTDLADNRRKEAADLDKIKDERLREEEQLEEVRLQRDRELVQLQRQRDELLNEREIITREKLKLHNDQKELNAKVAAERKMLETKSEQLNLLSEGLAAYAEGRLRFRPGDAVPFWAVGNSEETRKLRERLRPIRDQLASLIKPVDAALEKRVTQFSGALVAAVGAWSKGLLRGLGESRADGRPTFVIPWTAEGDELVKKIGPYRESVAKVVAALPDWHLVQRVMNGLSTFSSRLRAIEREEADQLQEGLSKIAGRDGKGLG